VTSFPIIMSLDVSNNFYDAVIVHYSMSFKHTR